MNAKQIINSSVTEAAITVDESASIDLLPSLVAWCARHRVKLPTKKQIDAAAAVAADEYVDGNFSAWFDNKFFDHPALDAVMPDISDDLEDDPMAVAVCDGIAKLVKQSALKLIRK